jgi:hypothetical protein
MLPAEKEADEVLYRDGFDLLAEAVKGVAVYPRKEAAVAPLFVCDAAPEMTAEHGAPAFDLSKE